LRVNTVGSSFTSLTGFIAAFVDSNGAYEGRLTCTNAGSGQYNLGVSKVTTSVGIPVWSPGVFNEGETHFIVLRYTYNVATTTDDQVDMWIDPDSSTFGDASAPASTLTAALTGTDAEAIAQFTFRQNTAGNTPESISYDELRVGRTWASVTPPYVPPPPALSVALSGANAVISWPTNHADGYALESIKGFDDTDGWQPVGQPAVVQGTNYTVTVTAGDDVELFRLKQQP
jgi:hypothetical protein